MKKNILTAILGAAILSESVCFAAIPQNQIVLGGVFYGASVSDVEKTLGQPIKTKIETKHNGGKHHDKNKHNENRSDANYNVEKTKWEYGNSLKVKFIDGKVCEIEAEDSSDAKTAAGIGIGADVSALEKAYGKADFIHNDKYIYCTDDKNLGLVFEIKNGKVHEIKCGVLKGRAKYESNS